MSLSETGKSRFDPIFLKKILGARIRREEFLKLSALIPLAIGGGTGVLLYTPERVPIEKEEERSVFTGWIEANTGSVFLQRDKGHFNFLREAIFANPILEELTSDFFKYLNARLEKKDGEEKRANLGEVFSYVLEKADAKLGELGQSQKSPQINSTLESLHAAVFVFAAGFMGQWFSNFDLERLGVSLEKYGDANNYFVHLERDVYPQLFSKEEFPQSDQFMNGQDRSAHFAQHLFVGFEYLYSRLFELGLHQSIPNFLKLLVYASSNNLEGQVRALSDWVGKIWEYSNLSDFQNIPIGKEAKSIHEGPFDLMVDADYKGNRLGVETGIALFNLAQGRLGIDELLFFVKNKLNDKKHYKFETEPQI